MYTEVWEPLKWTNKEGPNICIYLVTALHSYFQILFLGMLGICSRILWREVVGREGIGGENLFSIYLKVCAVLQVETYSR